MRVAIVGAGIAGLAAALTLSRRAREIVVVEQRTGFGESGAGIQISPNASRLLVDLGLGRTLGRLGCAPERMVVRAARSGREIGRTAFGSAVRDRFGAPWIAIARADLHAILLDAVRGCANVRLLVGREAVSAASDAATATLTLRSERGQREMLTADLVVGADGIGSRVRASIGDARLPRYGGYRASRATLPRERVPELRRGPETGLWLGRDLHVVHYPIAGGATLNLVLVQRRPVPHRGWSIPLSRDEVLDEMPAVAPALRDLLAVPETWAAWSLYDLPARSCNRGRIVLVGDAAHPVLPFLAQGGALAIEDAAVLAATLGDGGDVTRALARFACLRLGRVRHVQREARQNGRAYHAGGPVAAIRDVIIRRSGPDGLLRRYGWLYDWRPPA